MPSLKNTISATLLTILICGSILQAGDAPAPAKIDNAEIEKMTKDLGSEDFATREKASKALISAGSAAKAVLEKLSKDSSDAEVRERAASIVRAINMPRDFAALTAAEREIALLPFESKVTDNGGTVSFKNYASGSSFISDFGNIRVCIADTPYNGSSSGTISVGSGGGSASVNAGSFSVQSANGKTAIAFRALKWAIEKDVMKIAGQELEFGGYARKIVFLDKAGKFLKRCDIPEDAKPDKK